MPSSATQSTDAAKLRVNGHVQHEAWRKFLQAKENPFDTLVMPRKSDEATLSCFVPEVIKECWAKLLAIVDKYRPERVETERDIPSSGIVVIEAARGNGKTHTMNALQRFQLESNLRLVVAPTILDVDRPFHEFLLLELVRHLQEQAEGGRKCVLDVISEAFAKKVLLEGFRAESQISWLVRNGVGRRLDFWLSFLGWRTNEVVQRRVNLIEELEGSKWQSLSDTCLRNDVSTEVLRDICIDHILRTHSDDSVGQSIRRAFYCQLVRRAFGGSLDELFEFLSDGFAQFTSAFSPPRERVVQEHFRSIIEIFMLARVPIVFAFDSLEALLHEPPDQHLCNYFFQGMADFIDTTRGIPIIVFAETGHWIAATNFRSQYATHRMEQGIVGVPSFGTISGLKLPEATAQSTWLIANARILPLYREFTGDSSSKNPPQLPFSHAEITKEGGRPLRNQLQIVRDLYAARVHNERFVPASESAITQPAPGREFCEDGPSESLASRPTDQFALTEALTVIWKNSVTEAKATLSKLQSTQLQRMHLGFKIWLKALQEEEPGLGISNVENDSSGAIPFGWLTRFSRHQGSKEQNFAVAFFIGTGVNMPRDLKAKLEMFSVARFNGKVDQLFLLWARKPVGKPLDEMPPSTRDVWNSFPELIRDVSLSYVDIATLAQWAAIPKWDAAVRADISDIGSQNLTAFLAEHTRGLWKWAQASLEVSDASDKTRPS